MPNIGDIKVLKPRRGNRAVMNETRAGLILERGEMFLEFEGEIGSSICRIKIGDGVTGYANLPYALGDYTSSGDISNVEGILPIEHGGTGNPYGYIITGMIEEYTAVLNGFKTQYTDVVNAFKASYTEGASPSDIWSELKPTYPIIKDLNIDTSTYPPYNGTGYSSDNVILELENTPYYSTALVKTCESIGLGTNSTAEGLGTKATGENQTVVGKYNVSDVNNLYAFIVGNGVGDTHRSNAFTVDWNGNGAVSGNFRSNGRITAQNYSVGNKSLEQYIRDLIDSGEIVYVANAGHAETADSVDWDGIENKPSAFFPEHHTHVLDDITNFDLEDRAVGFANEAGLAHGVEWEDVKNKPDGVKPSAHNHRVSDITDISSYVIPNAKYANEAGTVEWASISNLPTEFHPESHRHNADEIDGPIKYTTEVVYSVAKLTEARELQTNLEKLTSQEFDGSDDATDIGIKGILPTAHGGTGNPNGTVARLTESKQLLTDLTSDSGADFDGSADASIGVTGILPTAHGGTGNGNGTVARLTEAKALKVKLDNTLDVTKFDGSSDVNDIQVDGVLKPENGGTGNKDAAAAKLVNPVKLVTNLSSASEANFDGSVDTSIGVSGILPTANGGTGNSRGYIQTGAAGVPAEHSTIEGTNNIVSGDYSYATGANNSVSANYAAALGYKNTISEDGEYSMAVGLENNISARYGIAMGYKNTVNSPGQTVIGLNSNVDPTGGRYSIDIKTGNIHFNDNDPANSDQLGSLFVIGDGVEGGSYNAEQGVLDLNRAFPHNCFRVVPLTYRFAESEEYISAKDFTGGIYFWGAVHYNGADYSEMFEWKDGNKEKEDRAGRFVTLDGDKIVFAGPDTDIEDVLGIVSANPSIIGDSGSENWSEMYETDIFGRVKYQEGFKIPEHKEKINIDTGNGIKEMEVTIPERVCMERKINKKFDANSKYIPREQRSEWETVGLLGKLVVVDDGTAKVNGFIRPSNNGIATHSNTRTPYRVMARLDAAHIKVFVKP